MIHKVEKKKNEVKAKKKQTLFVSGKNIGKLNEELKKRQIPVEFLDKDGRVLESKVGAVTKVINLNKTKKYFVMTGTNSKLFNPLVDKLNQKTRKKLPEFNFAEVNKKSYERYSEFLKTKNSYFLNQAELVRGL